MSGQSRRSPLFRGSELPRLLILAVIALAGWPMVLLFARSDDAPPPAPAVAVPVAQLAPVQPDDGIEFGAVRDKTLMDMRENAAYATLLERTRTTPPAELDRLAHRDIFWTQLFERPERYRGVPIHLEGTARRVLSYEINPAMAPSGRIFEAWVYSDENRVFPYVLTTAEAPPGLVVGPDLNLRVRFDGYFLKLLGYRAGDRTRAAPMLVGRLSVLAAPAAAPAPLVELRDMTRRNGVAIVLTVLVGYVLLRGFMQLRRAFAPRRPRADRTNPNRDPFAPPPATDIEPEALSAFLADLADEPDPDDDGRSSPPIKL